MYKGISFYFGFNIKPKERMRMIKNAGFDNIITTTDKRFNKFNGKLSKQIKLMKKFQLKPSSLHMSYRTKELPYFWKEGRKGDKIKKNLIKDVKLAKKYGFKCVVVHLLGEYSKIGEKRLYEVLDVCRRTNIPLAIENIDCFEVFYETFKNIDNDYLKFCYDSGHNNIFDKNYNYLDKFKNKLICLHLHDNNGVIDEHTISYFSGTINWDKVAQKLSEHKDISLDYELLNKSPNSMPAQEFLNKGFKQACELEKKICKCKKI